MQMYRVVPQTKKERINETFSYNQLSFQHATTEMSCKSWTIHEQTMYERVCKYFRVKLLMLTAGTTFLTCKSQNKILL